MITVKYKGCYINGYIDKPECTVCGDFGPLWPGLTFKSLHAAKLAITRNLNK